MGYRITYQGDDTDLLAAYLTALIKRAGEGNWLAEVVISDGGDDAEVQDFRLNTFDEATDTLTLGLVDDANDYEPTGETRQVPLHAVKELIVQ